MSIMVKLFFARLRELRTMAGVTQRQLAEYLNIRQPTYARYETGASEPNLETLVRIAKYFGVSCDYLLGVTEF